MKTATILHNVSREDIEAMFKGLHDEISKLKKIVYPKYEGELLTIKEAGELLNLSVPTLYGKVSRREIPFSKKGKRLYFSKQELTDWIKEGNKCTQ